MTKEFETDKIAARVLGKKTEDIGEYNPSILVAVPREENRRQYSIASENLPFDGWDVWHCYEFSALTGKNMPVTRVLKLKYSCKSPYIIESKSLKLYLNSFNMTNFGTDTESCLEECKALIEKDLSERLMSDVEANFIDDNFKREEIFSDYVDILSLTGDGVEISDYKENPELLGIERINGKKCEFYLKFGSLRSNCRVTHQPDFGDLYVYYKSVKAINYESLLKYLVSFRSEYHFHEECCEMIFKRLSDLLEQDYELMVAALYTRRGGIDITPIRYTKGLKNKDIDKILDLSVFARNGIKQ